MFNKKFSKTCAALIVSAASIVGIASCSTPVFNVEFMMKNDKGAWEVLETKESSDGKVELAEAPAKKYYTFGGWYNEESFETEFDNANVTSDTKAYAQYVPEEVNIHFNNDAPIVKNLVDLVNDPMKPNDGTTFDGWYKDSNYTLKWNGTDVVTDLYARYVAVVTYNNGYEDVYTTYVTPGKAIESPAKVVVPNGTETTTLEAKEIVKSYMDLRDINYVDAEGKAFDFSKPIEKNTTITVNWNTRGLGRYVEYDKDRDMYFLNTYYAGDDAKAKVWSIQSKFTIDVEKKEEGKDPVIEQKTVEVPAVMSNGSNGGWLPEKATKIIFGEGIKSIAGMMAEKANSVEEIVLPKSLKIIDNSFNNMDSLKGVNIPEGVEVLIGSFFTNTNKMPMNSDYKRMGYGDNHKFDITVPKSVKNLAYMPTNLKFDKDSKFAIEDGRLVKNVDKDNKILLSDPVNARKSTIIVPEGFTAIQVGTYNTPFDYLYLPKSLKEVSYNANLEDYPYYTFQTGSENSNSANHLYDAKNAGSKDRPLNTMAMAPEAYSITQMVGGRSINFGMMFYNGAGRVILKDATLPSTLNKYALCGDPVGAGFMNGTYVSALDDPQIKEYIVAKDNVDKVYISLAAEGIGGIQSFRAVTDARSFASVDEMIDLVKKQNPDLLDMINGALEGKTAVITENNAEITADKVVGEKFITIILK